ncbi:MAG: NADH-quinone oxidoreductase subunit C/D [Candidatus Tectomicrobia bacterium]|uniref:Multifunctional fusion protein n=1 Tax=Tectimicrobiota bacterium TaxID=2528274 RepID=A0A932CNT9_UNCTE|nr:NADH-quinone oxidoreductase subunit C/D [Candidatus Tectomicrobia bacterium]
MPPRPPIVQELRERFPTVTFLEQETRDGVPTLWVGPEHLRDVLVYLKREAQPPYPMLFDLSAVDERVRRAAPRGYPACDFSLLYQLLSLERNEDLRLRVPLRGDYPTVRTITDLWPSANWYEREVWDMFGIGFEGHPFLRRLLMPDYWKGHPLRKEHPARRTDMEPYRLAASPEQALEERYEFRPEEYGLSRGENGMDYMFLNLGPHHPGTHGVIRFVLQLEGEWLRDVGIQIGFHHRAQEKTAERQTFHTYIPYTDRIDYLAGYQNEFPYVMAVERLGGVLVPPRAQVIRVMLAELFRIANHLVWFGTFGADLGSLSPVFYTFNDREHIFDIIEAVSGFRMHPGWFRIGGVAEDLPRGWKELVDGFVRYFPARLAEYRRALLKNAIFKRRTKGIGVYTVASALEWGVTGPNLRAAGLAWDLRKARPYSGYDQFDFEVPTETAGDSYARALVRIEEMNQSLRIVEQAANQMPEGRYKSDHPLAMPPRKEETMQAIETLINHFLSVSWGQPFPVGEAQMITEAPKGHTGFYVMSDGSTNAYRTRIRTASFPIMQTVPWLSRGLLVADLIAILGSIDYVMGDIDR